MAIANIFAQIKCDDCESVFTLNIPNRTRIPGTSSINDFVSDAIDADPLYLVQDGNTYCAACTSKRKNGESA